MRIRLGTRLKDDAGSNLVEFSLVAFLFVILLLSVVEMGRMLLVYTTMSNAARAGTRYAIVHGSDLSSGASGPGNTTNVQTVVRNFAGAGLLSSSNVVVTVSYPANNNNPGSLVEVTASYQYDPLVGYFSSILNKTMGATSEGVITY